MAYDNRCGDCKYYAMPRNRYEKGYCEYYRAYYYPEDSCKHQLSISHPSTCYITTIACNVLGLNDDCDVLKTLRLFRDKVLQQNLSYLPILMIYDTIGPKLANKIEKDYKTTNDKTLCQIIYNNYLLETKKLIKENNTIEAINKYIEMINVLKEYYNIETTNIVLNSYDNTHGGHGKIYLKQKV